MGSCQGSGSQTRAQKDAETALAAKDVGQVSDNAVSLSRVEVQVNREGGSSKRRRNVMRHPTRLGVV